MVFHVKVNLSFLVRVKLSDLLFCALTHLFFLTLFSTPLAPLVTWNSLTGGSSLPSTALGGRRSNVSAPRLSDTQAGSRFWRSLPSTFTRVNVEGGNSNRRGENPLRSLGPGLPGATSPLSMLAGMERGALWSLSSSKPHGIIRGC